MIRAITVDPATGRYVFAAPEPGTLARCSCVDFVDEWSISFYGCDPWCPLHGCTFFDC